MSNTLKICEHESVEWICKRITKFTKRSFLKKLKIVITSFDVNVDFFIFGTNLGDLYIVNRKTNFLETFLIKKNVAICHLKLIHTVDLSVAIGFIDGSVFILTIPYKDGWVFAEIVQFVAPVEHHSLICCMTWSKNSEKLFTGDQNGLVCCSEINYQYKTISGYEICKTKSSITQLDYNYKILLISTDMENFMWNCNISKRIQIGSHQRTEPGKFGACFVKKLCKSAGMEIIVTRPRGQIWIGDSNGCVIKTIVLKSDMLFAPQKLINLLPCVTSQSKSNLDITGLQLGLLIPINEHEVLFWSEGTIIIVSITTGDIISSSYNLGKIKSISICHIDKLLETDLNTSTVPNVKKCEQSFYEIWILREPIFENDNKFVRISSVPLMTSKLLVDPFYLFSEAKIGKTKENVPSYNKSVLEHNYATDHQGTVTNDSSQSILLKNDNEKITKTKVDDSASNLPITSQLENWWNKIGTKKQNIDVVETLNDMRSNMVELTKKTKEALFETDEEGLEQAIELTEEGLMIKFENSIVSSESVNIQFDDRLQVKIDETITVSHAKRENRKIEHIHIEDVGEILDERVAINKTDEISLDVQSHDFEDEKVFPLPSNSLDSEYMKSDSGSFVNENIDQEMSPFTENFISFNDQISEEIKSINDENENKSLNGTTDDQKSESFLSNSESYSILISEQKNDFGETFEIQGKILSYSSESSESQNNLLVDDKSIEPPSLLENQYAENNIDLNNSDSVETDNISKTLIKDWSVPMDDPVKVDINRIEELPDNQERIEEMINEEVVKIDERKEVLLTNDILLKSNKWIIHRGPVLSGNAKLTSMTVNRRMIWLTDTKGTIYVGFINKDSESDLKINEKQIFSTELLIWIQEAGLRTDKIVSAPSGCILWRGKAGEISVYTTITKIWTPKVVKEKVLLKKNWESQMQGIKDVDLDEEMAVIATKKGKLKVINGISSRVPYRECTPVDLDGDVTLVTTFNGIIWCVTEISQDNTSTASQHIFACVAKDENGNFNISSRRTVPLPIGLVKENEQKFGDLGGSEVIQSVQLGTNCLAWILTLDNMCFFCKNVSLSNPAGDSIWYQITLHSISNTPSKPEDTIGHLNINKYGRVEKMFKYPDTDLKARKWINAATSGSLIMSVKCAPKLAKGNGLLWITSVERNSPCVLLESDRNILGHNWFDCFRSHEMPYNRLPGLPGIVSWIAVEVAMNDIIWLLHKSGELFCYLNEEKIRSVAVPSSYGQVVKVSAHEMEVAVITSLNKILIRIGIIKSNPFGTDWREIKPCWNTNEMIKNIFCSHNELWLIFENNVYFNENLQSLLFDTSRKSPWNLLSFKIQDSNSKKLTMIQIFKLNNINYIWGISDLDGYVYVTQWESNSKNFEWVYISGPRAKSIHVSDENLWMIEQFTGNIFVRCGQDWKNQPLGEYWVPIPVVTKPVIDLAVSPANHVFIINCYERLFRHQWTIIEGNIPDESQSDSGVIQSIKHDDQDWEMLN